MSDTPRLSVVITARNALRALPGAIASVGPHRDVEIIVADDASTDGSRAWLARLAAADARVRVVGAPLGQPFGSTAALRNAGIEAARAPWTAFLEPGDRWRAGKLARQLDLHRLHPGLAFSFTGHRRITEDGTELAEGLARCRHFAARHAWRREAFVLDRDAQAQIYAEPLVAPSTLVARTALLRAVGGFNTALREAEDWDLVLHLAACGPVGCVPRPLADTLVRALPPDAPRAERLRADRRRVAAAYLPAVAALDAAAPRAARLAQRAADADAAELAGHRTRAALLRLSTLAREPGRALRPARA